MEYFTNQERDAFTLNATLASAIFVFVELLDISSQVNACCSCIAEVRIGYTYNNPSIDDFQQFRIFIVIYVIQCSSFYRRGEQQHSYIRFHHLILMSDSNKV